MPEFRRAVYHMPTEEGEDPSESICVALKYLFFRLQYSHTPVSTKELINSFGWHSVEAFQQHDVQELELILYDKLEAKMKGTQFQCFEPLGSPRRLCRLIAANFRPRTRQWLSICHVSQPRHAARKSNKCVL